MSIFSVVPEIAHVLSTVQTPGLLIATSESTFSTLSFLRDAFIHHSYVHPRVSLRAPLCLPVDTSGQALFTQHLGVPIESLWVNAIGLLHYSSVHCLAVPLRQSEGRVCCVWIQ